MFKALAALGGFGVFLGLVLNLAIGAAVLWCWVVGVMWGFAHGLLLGLLSIPFGQVIGLLHLLHLI